MEFKHIVKNQNQNRPARDSQTVFKALTMLVGEVPLVCQRHELDLWMLLHIVLRVLSQHRVCLASAGATL